MIYGTRFASFLRRHFSKAVVAYSDRCRIAFEILKQLRNIRKEWPTATFRLQRKKPAWGPDYLALTDPFPLALSKVIPKSELMDSVRAEIRAFQEGEPAISAFFDEMDRPYEDFRRDKTPPLLEADPNEFEIQIIAFPSVPRRVWDGHHRLAIAEAAGLTHIKVVAVLPGAFGTDIIASNKPLSHWFLFPFSGTRD